MPNWKHLENIPALEDMCFQIWVEQQHSRDPDWKGGGREGCRRIVPWAAHKEGVRKSGWLCEEHNTFMWDEDDQ